VLKAHFLKSLYSACLALSLAPAPLFRGAGAYILPRMSHGYKDGSNKNLMRLLGKSILLLCPIYLLTIKAKIFHATEALIDIIDKTPTP
jgi:hypothetical protein